MQESTANISDKESFYLMLINQFHCEDIHKRKKTVLFKNIPRHINELVTFQNGNPASARINHRNLKRIIGILSDTTRNALIIRLILYIYVLPFLRLSLVMFLILFRYYHYTHPEFIPARMNNSTMISNIWTNYYLADLTISTVPVPGSNIITSPHTTTTTTTPTHIFQSPQIPTSASTTDPKQSLQSANHKTKSARVQYFNYSYLPLTTRTHQVVFYDYSDNNLLKPAMSNPDKKLVQEMLEPLKTPTPFIKHKTPAATKAKPKSKLAKQIMITKTNDTRPITKKKIIKKIHKRSNGKARTVPVKQSASHDDDDHINGYLVIDKKLVIIVENGKTYIYRVPQSFIDKYTK